MRRNPLIITNIPPLREPLDHDVPCVDSEIVGATNQHVYIKDHKYVATHATVGNFQQPIFLVGGQYTTGARLAPENAPSLTKNKTVAAAVDVPTTPAVKAGDPDTMIANKIYADDNVYVVPEYDEGDLLATFVVGSGVHQKSYPIYMPKDGYRVRFYDYNNTLLKTEYVMPGADATPPTTPVHTGLTFQKWNPSPKSIQQNTDIWAVFEGTQYTVVFRKLQDNVYTTIKTVMVPYGGSTTAPDLPTATGYTTGDWDNKNLTNIKSNLTITCVLTRKSYTINFVNDDGSLLESKTWLYNDTPSYGSTPSKTNPVVGQSYAFTGWTPAIIPVTADATYKATYSSSTNKYTVTFVDGLGSTLKICTDVLYGTTIGSLKPSNPTYGPTAQYYFSFTGWDTTDATQITGDRTVTATWNKTLRSYTVTFVDWDNTTLASRTVSYGTSYSSVTKPSNPSRTDYTFTGWGDPSPSSSISNGNVVGDCTVVANYQKNVITEVTEASITASDLVASEAIACYFKNFRVIKTGYLAHVSFTKDMLYAFGNTGTIFYKDTGDEISELDGSSTPVNKILGRGGCRYAYAQLKNKKLVTRVDIIPTYSIYLTTPSSYYFGDYYYQPYYWPNTWVEGDSQFKIDKNIDGVDNSYVNLGPFYTTSSTKNSIVHMGDYYKVVLHIDDNGTAKELSKVINVGIKNSVANVGSTISSLSATKFSFKDEIIAAGLSPNAYTTKVDIMESTSNNPSKWFTAILCGLRFFVNS